MRGDFSGKPTEMDCFHLGNIGTVFEIAIESLLAPIEAFVFGDELGKS